MTTIKLVDEDGKITLVQQDFSGDEYDGTWMEMTGLWFKALRGAGYFLNFANEDETIGKIFRDAIGIRRHFEKDEDLMLDSDDPRLEDGV